MATGQNTERLSNTVLSIQQCRNQRFLTGLSDTVAFGFLSHRGVSEFFEFLGELRARRLLSQHGISKFIATGTAYEKLLSLSDPLSS